MIDSVIPEWSQQLMGQSIGDHAIEAHGTGDFQAMKALRWAEFYLSRLLGGAKGERLGVDGCGELPDVPCRGCGNLELSPKCVDKPVQEGVEWLMHRGLRARLVFQPLPGGPHAGFLAGLPRGAFRAGR